VAAFRRSWLVGFTVAIGKRLATAEDRARADAGTGVTGPSVELVLADRSAIVDRQVEQAYPNLRTARPRRLQGSGHDGGYAAGLRADLGGAKLTGARANALSR
jgi:hypothetical protein